MLAVRVARARVGGSFRLLHWLAGVARSITALLTTSHGETRQCLTAARPHSRSAVDAAQVHGPQRQHTEGGGESCGRR